MDEVELMRQADARFAKEDAARVAKAKEAEEQAQARLAAIEREIPKLRAAVAAASKPYLDAANAADGCRGRITNIGSEISDLVESAARKPAGEDASELAAISRLHALQRDLRECHLPVLDRRTARLKQELERAEAARDDARRTVNRMEEVAARRKGPALEGWE